MSENSIYAQRILKGRNFRLLFIYPALEKDQGLECYCLPFEIDKAPPYEALSYVWGPLEPSTEIRCNGQAIAIRSELANALKNLRLQGATRTVWADALCINQGDHEERNNQVTLMGSIYSLARRVVVWLGHGDLQQTQEAFDCVKFIAEAYRQYNRDHNLDLNDGDGNAAFDLPINLFSPTVCSSLKDLFGRPWFWRIWCVQEIRLAQDALVLWGKHEISWTDLGLASSWIFNKTNAINRHGLGNAAFGSLLAQIDVMHADIMHEKTACSLFDTLRNFYAWESTDPKDKVYGLLNIVSPRSEVEALNVDYTKSVGEVYASTARTVIQLSSRLTALAYIVHPEDYDGDDEYRSWAPRWDDLGFTKLLGVPEMECPWSPCDRRAVTMADVNHLRPNQLCLTGIFYDRVHEVEEIMSDEMLADPEYANGDPKSFEHSTMGVGAESQSVEMHPLLKAFEKIEKNSYLNLSSEEFLQQHCSLARTMTAGTFTTDQYVQNLDHDTQVTYFKSFADFIVRLTGLHYRGHEANSSHSVDSKRFEQEAYEACSLRRIFWTENGSLGLGPQCMDIDDIVVVLYGGNTPYVLRPVEDEYLFMGQAYVDNIMQGELMHNLREGRAQEQLFCIV